MSAQAPELRVVRLPLTAWNAACEAVRNDASASYSSAVLAELIQYGLVSADGVLADDWRQIIQAYQKAPIDFLFVSSYRDMVFEARVALAGVNICVAERYRTEPAADGTLVKVAHDRLVEVSMTYADPWNLVVRVLPPLPSLRAPARQTSEANARPIVVPDSVKERARALIDAQPTMTAAAALEEAAGASDEVRALLDEVEASVTFLGTYGTETAAGAAMGSYLASADGLYRAQFTVDAGWYEVAPGDLAYAFMWHRLGALDALARLQAVGE